MKTKANENAIGFTPDRVRAIRKAHGMTLREAADHIGVAIRTWQNWETPIGAISSRRPRGAARKALEKMEASGRFIPNVERDESGNRPRVKPNGELDGRFLGDRRGVIRTKGSKLG